jgi:hypothetical protein
MGKCKDNMVLQWVKEITVGAGQGETYTCGSDGHLQIGNFSWVGIALEVLAGGSSDTTIQFEHAIDPDGTWANILGSREAMANRTAKNICFETDDTGDLLYRFLRWNITNSSYTWEVTFKMTVLLRR